MDDKPGNIAVTSVNGLMQAVRSVESEDDWINAIIEIHENLNVRPLIGLLHLGRRPPPSALRALADLLDAESEHSATPVALIPVQRKGQTPNKEKEFMRRLQAVAECERLIQGGLSVEEAVKKSAENFGCEPRHFWTIRKEVLPWIKWVND